MAIVVEQIDKSGHVLHLTKFDSHRVSLGRAFDNDLILTDPSVDAHHGLLSWDPISQQLRAQDRGALNGVWVLDERGKKHRLIGTAALHSGQRLMFGKTLVRVYESAHPVVAATPAHLDQAITGFLENLLVMSALAALAASLMILDLYLDQPTGKSLAEFGLEALYGLFAVAIYSGFWALLGKNLRQDARYWLHLSLSFIAVNLWILGELAAPVIAFNLQLSETCIGWLSKLLISLLGGSAVYLSCLYATRLTIKPRLAIALILPLALISKPLIALFEKQHFNPAPAYSHTLIAPSLQWRHPSDSASFMPQAENLYPAWDPSQDDTTDSDNSGDNSDNTDSDE